MWQRSEPIADIRHPASSSTYRPCFVLRTSRTDQRPPQAPGDPPRTGIRPARPGTRRPPVRRRRWTVASHFCKLPERMDRRGVRGGGGLGAQRACRALCPTIRACEKLRTSSASRRWSSLRARCSCASWSGPGHPGRESPAPTRTDAAHRRNRSVASRHLPGRRRREGEDLSGPLSLQPHVKRPVMGSFAVAVALAAVFLRD